MAADRRDGYMLVEMVAALALTGLLLAFVLPLVSNRTGRTRLLGLVSASAALLRDARSEAIRTASTRPARFYPGARQLRLGSRSVTVPADVEVSLVAGGNCPVDGKVAQILFRPDGTNCGGVLRFAEGSRVLRVRVDWVDGRIDVAQGD